MASVHLGSHAADGTRVAIKVMRPDVARQPDFVSAFGQELRAAAGLNHHRITAIYDHGVVSNQESRSSPEYTGAP
jgi:serine/threonine-protein kinase